MSSALAEPASDPLIEDTRAFFRRLASGVGVVTCPGPEGPIGLTASTITSVSLCPPLLLMCVAGASRKLAPLLGAGQFIVHLLREDQERISNTFAGAPGYGQCGEFELAQIEDGHLLRDCLAWALCNLEATMEAGDHVIVVGRVRRCANVTKGAPLLWHDSKYHQLMR